MLKRKIGFLLVGLAFPAGCFSGIALNWLAFKWMVRLFPGLDDPMSLFVLAAFAISGIVCGTLAKWWAEEFFRCK